MTENEHRQSKSKQTAVAAGAVDNVCYIDRLQTEILCEIFLFSSSTITAADFEREYIQSRIITDPTSLTFVNKRWNAIALAMPSLWSKIYVSIQSFSHGSLLEFFVDHRLKLSKNAPLDICVLFSEDTVKDWDRDRDRYRGGDSDSDEDYGASNGDYGASNECGVWEDYESSDEDSDTPQVALPILAKLFQHAHRWKSAILQLPESREFDHTEFPDTFPLLQELEMRWVSCEATEHCPSFHAPLLRKFTMEKFMFDEHFGCSHLNEITLSWVSPNSRTFSKALHRNVT
ncbi:hypothetical protein BDP27DRAFT_397092 [Rhodocollybia butyracea]|uniref:F-box domain-containing protein n=1 Tax=Rhodocollybia butyracea TaxID=206335 RepID=A0A9P5Q032_9AGAR|nr:hypothetical protein BDP27DRAFT_397092 [Rhodocollybia butyracea]